MAGFFKAFASSIIFLIPFFIIVTCDKDLLYRKYISPFSDSNFEPMEQREMFPSFTSLVDIFRFSNKPPGRMEDPEVKLELSKNRFAIVKAGFTCGVPGNGLIDPFELGPKFQASPNAILARKTKTSRFKNTDGLVDVKSLRPLQSLRFLSPRFLNNNSTGQPVEPNVLCWQVKIRFDLGNGTSKICGGSIVGSRTILTAAHCLLNSRKNNEPFHPSLVSVQVGDVNAGDGCAEILPVELLVPHANYDVELEDNDIGLLILRTEVDFTRKPCACKLCVKDEEPTADDVCIVYGYGKQFESEISNDLLTWRKQRVLPQTFDSRCAFHIGGGRITDLNKFICAGDLMSDTSCQGDQGSSFVCFDPTSASHYAAGIVSFSAGCGKRIGSQYTKVKPYLNWIEDNSPAQDVRVQRGWNREIARELS